MLLVETGYGTIGAESYATVAEAVAYWTGRPGPDAAAFLAAEEAEQEGALRGASEYLDLWHLRGMSPLVDGQGLSYPFEDRAVSLGDINLVRRATIMIAPLALAGPLVGTAPSTPMVISSSSRVGDISESTTYAQPTSLPVVVAGRDLSFLVPMLSGLRGGGIVIGHRHLG